MNRIFLVIALLLLTLRVSATDLNLEPSPSLDPQDVVKFQLQALRANNGGDGIEATFRFASPNNRAMTGPLERFSKLFENDQYGPMLNHQSAEVELLSIDDSSATVLTGIVDNEGNLHWYRFELSRQSIAPYLDCWMTDAVMREQRPGQSA